MSARVSRRAGRLLVTAVVLTGLSFTAATLLTEWADAGVAEAAHTIATISAPGVSHLSGMRGELRRLEVLMDDYTDEAAAGQGRDGLGEALDTRDSIRNAWEGFLALVPNRAAHPFQDTISDGLDEIDRAIAAILDALDARHGADAERVLNRELKPAIDRVDRAVAAARDFNQIRGGELAKRVERLQARALQLAVGLDVVSALLAVTAALVAVRVVRQNVALLEGRAEELDQFAGRLAHDVRGPLGNVQLALELVERRGDPAIREPLARALRSTRRMSSVVDGLLAFTRAAARPEPGARADVATVIDAVLEESRAAAEERAVELAVAPFPSLAVACAPPILGVILGNLVGNAVKFIGERPIRRVTVRVRDEGALARIEVEDTGPGLPADAADLWKPLVRGRTAAPGIGLGLATVRRLAEAHGGRAGARSSAAGSTFWVTLPKA